MEVHIDVAFHVAQFPQSGVFPLVGEGQFAAGVDDASDDHRQAILDLGFFTRVKSAVQSKFLGQLQQGKAGPVFLGAADLEILCGALGQGCWVRSTWTHRCDEQPGLVSTTVELYCNRQQ
jgi:hypothetical protein